MTIQESCARWRAEIVRIDEDLSREGDHFEPLTRLTEIRKEMAAAFPDGAPCKDREICRAVSHLNRKITSCLKNYCILEDTGLRIPLAFLRGQTISPRDLRRVMTRSAREGNLGALRYFLSQSKEAPDWDAFEVAAEAACERGHKHILSFLFLNGFNPSADELGALVKKAATHGHTSIVELLMMRDKEIPTADLLIAITLAAVHQHIDTGFFLLDKLRVQMSDLRDVAVDERICTACSNIRGSSQELVHALLDFMQFRISRGLTSDEKIINSLELIVYRYGSEANARYFLNEVRGLSRAEPREASQIIDDAQRMLTNNVSSIGTVGNIGAVRFLLSIGHEMPPSLLGNAVLRAVRTGDEASVRFLLSDGRSISSELLGSILIQATSRGRHEIVEFLLQQGPIHSHVRDSAITNAQGPHRDEIREILRHAEVIAPVGDGGGEGLEHEPGRHMVCLEDVRQNPLIHLGTLIRTGLPDRIGLFEYPRAVDLGGVFKQFISTLCSGLVDTIPMTTTHFPTCLKEIDFAHLRMVGMLFGELEKRNAHRMDRFVTGTMFNPQFFELVKLIGTTEEPERLETIARRLQTMDPAHNYAAEVVLNPDSLEAKQAYAENILGVPYEELEEEERSSLAADAEKDVLGYVNAAKAIYDGMGHDLQARLLASDPISFAKQIQGEEASVENLIAALRIRDLHPPEHLMQKREWLIEVIRNSDQAWRKAFVKAVTGNEVLSPGVKIDLNVGWREPIEFHTCYNSISVPPVAMSKEDFIELVTHALGAEYNIA